MDFVRWQQSHSRLALAHFVLFAIRHPHKLKTLRSPHDGYQATHTVEKYFMRSAWAQVNAARIR